MDKPIELRTEERRNVIQWMMRQAAVSWRRRFELDREAPAHSASPTGNCHFPGTVPPLPG